MNEIDQGKLNEQFFDAIRSNQVEKARSLIANGAKFNQSRYGDTPLFHAATNGSIEIVELLIKAGANGVP